MGTTPSEAAIQRWLVAHPALPGVGELLLVGRAGRLEQLVDILFLSADGALVLVEVKKQRTTREIIGQVLEYAARLRDATLEEIANTHGRDVDELRGAFLQRFGRTLTVSSERHIVLVAPEFDITCHVIVPYLRHLAGDKGVAFHLVRAVSEGERFELKPDAEPVLASRIPPGSCGVSHHGTCYVVLHGGAPPILWRVGAVDDGEIVPSQKPALRFDDRLLRPFAAAPETLSLSESGSSWVKQTDPASTAVVLGMLRDQAEGDVYHLARLRSGRFESFKRKRATDLHGKWTRSIDVFDWRTLRGLTKQ